MAGPSNAEVRAVLRENGRKVPERGKVSADHVAQWRELTGGADDIGPDGDGVSAAGFPDGAGDGGGLDGVDGGGLDGVGGPGPAEPGPAETRPRRVGKRARPARLRDRLRSGAAARPRAAADKKRLPRVSTEKFAGRAWQVAARLVTPVIPPVGRCLALQAPVAGIIFEDVAKGTIVDRGLQPVIRAEEKAEKTLALFGPALIVGVLSAAEGLPEDQKAIRQAMLLPMLRELLVLNVEIAGTERITAAVERAGESAEVAARVDAMLAQIFAPPAQPGGPAGDGQPAAQMAPA